MHQLRARQATESREHLTRAGVALDDDGSILAAAHRRYLDLKDLLSGSDGALIGEVLRGEHELLDTYNKVIEPMGSEDPAYNLVIGQHRALEVHLAVIEKESRTAA